MFGTPDGTWTRDTRINLLHLLLHKQTNIYLRFQAPRLIFVRHCEAILTDIKKSSFIYSPDG